MKHRALLPIFLGVLIATFLLYASGWVKADVVHFAIDSADYNDGSYYIGGYHSGFTNPEGNLYVPVLSFCVDFTSHVGFGQTFEVNVVNLHDFTGSMHDNYWEAGWLALQLSTTTDVPTISNIQRAMWLITTPGSTDPYLNTPASLGWVHDAIQNYQSVSDSNFVLYLRSGAEGQSQLSVVPEPSVNACIGIGVLSLLGFLKLGRDQRRNRK